MPERRPASRAPRPGPPPRDFALEVYFSRWQEAARHDLAASHSETLSLAELLALASDEDRAAWQQLALGYADPRGSERLRRAIAAGYSALEPARVLCFAGAQEAIHAALHALLGPGDHAVVVLPNYQSIETIPHGIAAVSGVALEAAHGWTLDIDAVERALRPNTRLVAINFPNNPTGKVLERDRFEALVALCRRRGLWLFSDEVYRLIERDPALRLPAAVDAYERGISLGALSKSFGLPGLRIGWIACRDRRLLQRMERLKHYLSICNAAPSERLAAIALEAAEPILARNRAIAATNLALISGFFAEHADLFSWHVPEGGTVAFARYAGEDGVEAFCARAIEREGVLLLPASVYRSALAPLPADRFRIGFGRAGVAAGLRALSRVLPRASAAPQPCAAD